MNDSTPNSNESSNSLSEQISEQISEKPKSSAKSRGKTIFKIVLGLAISAGLLALVLSRMDSGAALARLDQLNINWLFAAAAASFGVLLSRTLRFFALTDRSTPVQVGLATALQNFINRVTPLRLGELSLPYLLHLQSGEIPGKTLCQLLLVRMVEFWLAALCVLAGTLLHFDLGNMTYTLSAVLVVMTAALVAFRPLLRFAARVGRAICEKLPNSGLIRFLQKMIRQVDEASNEKLSTGRLVALLVGSASVIGLQAATFYSIMAAFGVFPSLAQILIGASVAHVAGGLPILSVGTIGPHETAWTLAFVAVGLVKDDAIFTGLATQLVTLGFAAFFGVIAWLWFSARQSRAQKSAK